jgi:hypothetical protein
VKTSTKIANIKKSLTNILHTRVLEIIGSSPTPLSSREIELLYYKKYKMRDVDNKKKDNKSKIKHSYIYTIIQELSGFNRDINAKVFFLSWNKLILNKDEKNFKTFVMRKLNSLFNYPKYDIKDIYIFKPFTDESYCKLEIYHIFRTQDDKLVENNILTIHFKVDSKWGSLITATGEIPLHIKHDKDDFMIYVRISDTTKKGIMNENVFINHTLDNRSKEIVSKLGGNKMNKPNILESNNRHTIIRDI